MITRVEYITRADDTIEKVRVYHRAGTTPEQGADTRYAWTHPYVDRDACDACVKGTIPAAVKAGR